MRKLLAIVPLAFLLASCGSFTWKGQGGGVSDEQAARGIRDVEYLTRAYDTETYFRSLRRRKDGRANAFGRDLSAIQSTIDRHIFNYSPGDPSVNYESDVGVGDHVMRFGTTFLAR
ncbi:MAG: hypothetical protein QF412_09565 [Planctomycetota bacterium]|jgi:hypothetical protein|nr:hypothetical protein [Planctomycetota bacterium]